MLMFFGMAWDKSCLLWVPVSPSTSVDSNYRVLEHALPAALNKQITIVGIYPLAKIKHCCYTTTSNEWTLWVSCHPACHWKHWTCDLSFTESITQGPALWGKQNIGTGTQRTIGTSPDTGTKTSWHKNQIPILPPSPNYITWSSQILTWSNRNFIT